MLKPGEPGPRRRALLAALAAARVRFQPGTEPPAVTLVKRWLDTWSSIGVIAAGMARQGYDLQLARYGDEGWRATFYVAGREHSPTQATGSAWEPTPWRAVQAAAWATLERQWEP